MFMSKNVIADARVSCKCKQILECCQVSYIWKIVEHAASSIIESFLHVTDAIFSWKDHVFTRRYKYILWTRVHIGELFSLFSSVFFALFYFP